MALRDKHKQELLQSKTQRKLYFTFNRSVRGTNERKRVREKERFFDPGLSIMYLYDDDDDDGGDAEC